MTVAVYVGIYLGLLIFLAGCIRRVMQYARAPIHLRWELYPVPHEDPERAAYGGSCFETSNWWTRRSHFNWRGELRAMLPEIPFLERMRKFDRGLRTRPIGGDAGHTAAGGVGRRLRKQAGIAGAEALCSR